MSGRRLEGGLGRPGGRRIISGCCAWWLDRLKTTFLEVDGWKNSRLHQNDFLSFIVGRNDFVAHFPVDVDFAFGQLDGVRGTIYISRIMSSYLYRSRLVGETPALTLPLRRVPMPSAEVFYCLGEGGCTWLLWSGLWSGCNWPSY